MVRNSCSRSALRLATLLALMLALPAAALALPAEVILATNQSTGQAVALASDGSALSALTCGGDLTRGPGPRHFASLKIVGGSHPAPRTELVAHDEDCLNETQLTSDPDVHRVLPRWSPTADRLAYGAERADPLSGVTERGIFLAEVIRNAGGSPVGVVNERLAVALPTQHVAVSWAADGCRLAYELAVGANDYHDIFVVNVCATLPTAGTNLTNTAGASEYRPTFHPALDRIAFARRQEKGGPVRLDIFVLDLQSGRTAQVTSKKNANLEAINNPAWSPDGQYIAFHGSGLSVDSRMDVYKVRSDGSGKALSLTSAYTGSFVAPNWR